MKSVYVISSSAGLIKVGLAISPLTRLNTLKNASGLALKLEWSAQVDDAGAVESAAHRILQQWRVNGEWFAVAAEHAIAVVKQVIEGGRPLRVPGKRPTQLRLSEQEHAMLDDLLRREDRIVSKAELVRRLIQRAHDGQNDSASTLLRDAYWLLAGFMGAASSSRKVDRLRERIRAYVGDVEEEVR